MEESAGPIAEGLKTEDVDVSLAPLAHNYLELQVVQADQKEYRFPFFGEEIDLEEVAAQAFPEPAPWVARLQGSVVQFQHKQSSQKVQLGPGETTTIAGRAIWLVDVRTPPIGSLECITEPFAGQVWHLKNQQSWIGRAGKRINHIELDHPTVSRTHATLRPDPQGRVSLLAESSAPTTINGENLASGQSQVLKHGDLLGLGRILFRFTGSRSGSESSLLSVSSLGPFRVHHGQALVEISNKKARLLCALLAAHWGSSVPAGRIMDMFWPEVSEIRARKNLSYTYGQLKQAFSEAGADPDELILRTPNEIGFNPEHLGTHDYWEVITQVRQGTPITSKAALQRFLELSKGEFLPSIYESWAQDLRTELDNGLRKTLLSTAAAGLAAKEAELVRLAAERLLSLEPTDEEAAGYLMEEALLKAEPQRAVEVFETLEKRLKREQMEPRVELLKLYQRARLGL